MIKIPYHSTDQEYHVDLRCWMALASKLMVNIGKLSPNYLINEPIKARPNWSLVEKVMKGELPISTLGCD